MKTDTLSLAKVLDEPVPFGFELSFSVADLDREPLLEISPVRFEGEVTRIEQGFALNGRLAYRGHLECSRCLAPYAFQESEAFSLVLYKRRPLGPEERELERADLDAYFFDEPEVAVAPIVEERIQLAVPMKPLCRPECRGLCPQCGADWNRERCNCAAETVDPRWEALRDLAEAPARKSRQPD
jgi:uncharacterized protein